MRLMKKSEVWSGARRRYETTPTQMICESQHEAEKVAAWLGDVQTVRDWFETNKRCSGCVIDDARVPAYLRHIQYSERMPESLKRVIDTWKKKIKSPYSDSWYDAEVGWDFKPEGSYRISDHWGWVADGQQHCAVEGYDGPVNRWMLCVRRNGKYVEVTE